MLEISLILNNYLVAMAIFATFFKKTLKDIMRINFVRTMKLKPMKGRTSRLLFYINSLSLQLN